MGLLGCEAHVYLAWSVCKTELSGPFFDGLMVINDSDSRAAVWRSMGRIVLVLHSAHLMSSRRGQELDHPHSPA